MRDNLAQVVESVRSRFYDDSVDSVLVQRIVEIEKQYVEDRVRAQEAVARVIQEHLDRSVEI
ncbi:hypothetical protein OOK29_03405 [Streptomyces phaeochromogenes]|uniref:hypothetical protein n=1 Tax=Streptomyces phaeochromogenes TaxID=1923 RepID=UPI0022598ADB|nr:hypothetical protein [Streptomyces phaeochromogenes]MCX5597174.1 hypothetical protein [Streptomyces phaeochromogenes]